MQRREQLHQQGLESLLMKDFKRAENLFYRAIAYTACSLDRSCLDKQISTLADCLLQQGKSAEAERLEFFASKIPQCMG